MEESVDPPEAKRPRVGAEVNEEEDEGLEGLGGASQGLEGPAPSSWLPSSAGSESQGGPSSVDSGLSGVTNKILIRTILQKWRIKLQFYISSFVPTLSDPTLKLLTLEQTVAHRLTDTDSPKIRLTLGVKSISYLSFFVIYHLLLNDVFNLHDRLRGNDNGLHWISNTPTR